MYPVERLMTFATACTGVQPQLHLHCMRTCSTRSRVYSNPQLHLLVGTMAYPKVRHFVDQCESQVANLSDVFIAVESGQTADDHVGVADCFNLQFNGASDYVLLPAFLSTIMSTVIGLWHRSQITRESLGNRLYYYTIVVFVWTLFMVLHIVIELTARSRHSSFSAIAFDISLGPSFVAQCVFSLIHHSLLMKSNTRVTGTHQYTVLLVYDGSTIELVSGNCVS